MKIGILTFHRSVNNGALLQCYALSKQLQKDFPGDTVEVIDYHMPIIEKSYNPTLLSYLKSESVYGFLSKSYHLLRDPLMLHNKRKLAKVFSDAVKLLPLSDVKIIENSTESLTEYINSNYDVLIVGSDAVWNFTTRGFPNAYLPDKRIVCRKVSYAASCYGMDYLSCTNEQKECIREALEDFELIGVRDCATEDFVRWSGCKNIPIHTCDPTTFIDLNDLPIDVQDFTKKLIRKGFDFNKPTVGVMADERVFQRVKKIYGDSYQLVALYNKLPGADVQLYDISPFEWAYVFRFFKFTVTTYFHGTMLSLRNGVPVICIALDTEYAKNHTPKVLDVLNRLNYSDWYIHTNDEMIDNKIKSLSYNFTKENLSPDINKKLEIEARYYDIWKSKLNI